MAAAARLRPLAVLLAASCAFAADLHLRRTPPLRHELELLERGRAAGKALRAPIAGGGGDIGGDHVAASAVEEDLAVDEDAVEAGAAEDPDDPERGAVAEEEEADEEAAVDDGGAGGDADAAQVKREEKDAEKTKEDKTNPAVMSTNEKWLSFWYWKPFICSVGFMMAMVDGVGPLYDKFVSFSLQSEVVLLIVTVFGFAFTVFYTMVPAAAGVVVLLAYATIGCTLSLLVGILTLSMTLRGTKKADPLTEIFTDIAKLFRFLLRVVQVVIILNVITTEAAVDWGQLAMLMGFMMLGIALSLSGVIGDIMAHIFLRMDKHFHEGDYIIFEDDLVQIEQFGWRHTIGVKDSNAAFIYIPNSMLTGASLVNQSQDNDRQVEVDILVDMDADKIEQALKNCWSVFERTKDPDFEFTGPDGEVYSNQFNTDVCDVWLNASCDNIHITFVGLYFFSKPEPLGEEAAEEAAAEGEEEDRQMDWENGWYFQIQWFHVECKKLNEGLAAWPYLDSWGPSWSRPAAE